MRKYSYILAALMLLFVSTGAQAATLNINTASAQELARVIDGVGTSKARAIVQYRQKHGAFQSVSDLVKVKGIGKATVERNRSKLTVR